MYMEGALFNQNAHRKGIGSDKIDDLQHNIYPATNKKIT